MKTCTIEIYGNTAKISGDFYVDRVKKASSYSVEGARFSPAFRKGFWDGKVHLFNEKAYTFPAGLTDIVKEALEKDNPDLSVVVLDHREGISRTEGSNGFELKGVSFGEGIYDYQREAAETIVRNKRGVLKIATNGGKTSIAAAVTQHLSLLTLFVVPGIELLYQTQASFAKYLGIDPDDIGIIGDGNFRVGKWITIALLDSLHSRLKKGELEEERRQWQMVWVDECHTAGSETCYEALNMLFAYRRYGLSGTPMDRSDGAALRLIAQTGNIIYEVRNKALVERGISVQPIVEIITIREPVIPPNVSWQTAYTKGVVENTKLNEKITEKTHDYCVQGKQCIIMVERVSHGENFLKLMEARSDGAYQVQFIHGTDTSEVRSKALKDFSAGHIQCLVTTSILDQGVDLDCIDVMVFAVQKKGTIGLLQRAGRGLRTGKGREEVIIIDIANFCHPWLIKHSLKRIKTFKKEECFKIVMCEE